MENEIGVVVLQNVRIVMGENMFMSFTNSPHLKYELKNCVVEVRANFAGIRFEPIAHVPTAEEVAETNLKELGLL